MTPLLFDTVRCLGLFILFTMLIDEPITAAAAAGARCALHGRTVSVYVQTPTGWEACERGRQHDYPGGFDPSQGKNVPGYSSLQFVLPDHPGAAVLEVRVSPVEKIDTEGQAAIYKRALFEERKNYPAATSRTVGRVATHGHTVWIQRMESDGYESYSAIVPLGAETIHFSLLFLPDATRKDKAHRHDLRTLLESCMIQ